MVIKLSEDSVELAKEYINDLENALIETITKYDGINLVNKMIELKTIIILMKRLVKNTNECVFPNGKVIKKINE